MSKANLPANIAAAHISASAYGWSPAATNTVNDTAFVNALAAAIAAQLPLYLGVGTFHVTQPLNCQATSVYGGGLEVYGASRQNCIIINDTDSSELLQVGGFGRYFHDFNIQHTSSSPTSSTGGGLVFYKSAYSTFKRLQINNSGRSVTISQTNVYEPGTSSGTGNYMFSNTFEDINVLRYAVNALFLNGYNGGSTGSAWTNIYLQNLSTGGTQLSSTGNAVDIYLCDAVFNQLNIEDLTNTKAMLINAQSTVVIHGLHMERVHLVAGGTHIQSYGNASVKIDGLSICFSNIALSGTGNTKHLQVQAGGQLAVGSFYLNGNTQTVNSGVTYTLGEVGDTNASNALEIGNVEYNANPTLTAVSNSTTNSGLKRIGSVLYGLVSGTALSAAATQVFTTVGTSTWTKPSGVNVVRVQMIGGGGGGGAGRQGATSTVVCGGGGGGGGSYTDIIFQASDLNATESVIVGAGGIGGTAQATADTNGVAGGAATASSFGTTLRARATQGTSGSGGTNVSGTGGSGASGLSSGAAGASASTSGAQGGNGSQANFAGSGGGAGGGLTTANGPSAGGTGATCASFGGTSPAGGTNPGGVGTAGTGGDATIVMGGSSGAGGGSSANSVGGTGGAGGIYGAGGGGGGASQDGFASGAGGAGAPGIVVVTCW